MELVKGRTVEAGQKVKVYVNLNQQGRFSLVDAKSGLVVAYAETVHLADGKFHVGESGRKKILESKRKRVHAWVTGILLGVDIEQPNHLDREVYYNPYTHEKFTDTQNAEVVNHAQEIYFVNKKCYIQGDA